MKKAYSVVLSLLLVFTACAVETGCTSNQFNTVLNTISTQLPAAEALAQNIATLANDPVLSPFVTTIGNAAAADLPILQAAISTYQASSSTGKKQAIFDLVSALATGINAQVLAANKVANPSTQADALKQIAAIAAVVNGFQLVLAPFFNGKTTSAMNARATYESVSAYIPRQEKEKVARSYGYSLAEAEAFGL